MKKTTVILLLCTHLFATTELSQLFKIPELIAHYIEHREENSNLTFLDFLSLHYGKHGETQHQNLPFKIPNICATSAVYYFQSPIQFSFNYQVFPIKNPPINAYHNLFYSSYFLNTIWQPPRAA